MSTKVVKCMCEECSFNEEHECHANNVQIHSVGDHKVESSAGTCCSTFKPRKK